MTTPREDVSSPEGRSVEGIRTDSLADTEGINVNGQLDADKPRANSNLPLRSTRGLALELDSKASSDPDLHGPKEQTFAFRSVDHGLRSGGQTSWGRTTITKAKNLFGKVQRSLSHAPPVKETTYRNLQRHTSDGVCMDPLLTEDPYDTRSRADSSETTRTTPTSRTGSGRSSRMVSFRSLDGSIVIHDGGLPSFIAENSQEDEDKEDDSFVAIPHVHTRHTNSESDAFGRIGGSFDQITTEATRVVKALNVCQRFALKPTSIILKLIGWRRFRKEGSDLHQPCYIRVGNTLYPLIVIFILIVALVLQSFLCISRTDIISRVNTTTVQCGAGFVTTIVLPDIIIMASYLLGLYVFRFQLPDHYYTVMETAFLSFTWIAGSTKIIRRVVILIVGYLFVGLLFLILSLCLNVMRLVSINPLDTSIEFSVTFQAKITFDLNDHTELIVLLVIAFVGLTIFDIFYVVVIVTYSSECQLLIYYISNIRDRVKNSSVPFDVIIKDINNLRDFMKNLNGNLSHALSLLLFNFLSFGIRLFGELYILEAPLENDDASNLYPYILGTLSLTQWIIFFFVPIIQATRLTYAGKKIKSLGLDLRARPYVYAETPQLDLDSLEMYCANVDIKARFAHVPMYPSLVVGLLFAGGIVLVSLFRLDRGSFPWATWL